MMSARALECVRGRKDRPCSGDVQDTKRSCACKQPSPLAQCISSVPLIYFIFFIFSTLNLYHQPQNCDWLKFFAPHNCSFHLVLFLRFQKSVTINVLWNLPHKLSHWAFSELSVPRGDVTINLRKTWRGRQDALGTLDSYDARIYCGSHLARRRLGAQHRNGQES